MKDFAHSATRIKCVCLCIILLGFMFGCKLPTETGSKKAILSIRNYDYDYLIMDTQTNVYVLNSNTKKISFGNREYGYYYDEPHHVQYKDGEVINLTNSDMTEFDDLASEYLDRICFVLDNLEYEAYPDSRNGYKKNNYYFALSEEGLKRFGNGYTGGRIEAFYWNGKFQHVNLYLYKKETFRPVLQFTCGRIDYVPSMPME